MWIIGLLFILWIGGYTVEAIPTKPHLIPFIILWSIMLIAGFIDIIRAGREGRGGFIILIAGAASYIYLLFAYIMAWESESAAPVFLFSFPLIGSGLLFYICGRRRRKLKE